jgi:hypothetical protein
MAEKGLDGPIQESRALCASLLQEDHIFAYAKPHFAYAKAAKRLR